VLNKRKTPIRDLFTKLYAYRAREDREPLEDWLTECLAVVLKSLRADSAISLLASLLERPAAEIVAAIGDSKLSYVTQYGTAAGRPDLVLTLDDRPWIIFENKVSHGVGDQLDRYGEWLASNPADHIPWHALVYLTHATPPPVDFTGPDWEARFGGRVSPCVLHWGRLARELISMTADDQQGSLARAAAEGFYGMLESKQMTDEFPSSQSFAALEVFLANGVQMDNLVKRMWEQVCHAANSHKTQGRQVAAQPEYGCYVAWRYVLRAAGNDSAWSYLQTGLWCADLARWWSAEELVETARGVHVYVFFGNDNDEHVFDHVTGAPRGWLRPAQQFFVHRSLFDFSTNEDARALEILDWCKTQADELKTFLIAEKLTTF
jgi:hypothetical protein